MEIARPELFLPQLGTGFRIHRIKHAGGGDLENHAFRINRGTGFRGIRQAPGFRTLGLDRHGIFRRSRRQRRGGEVYAFQATGRGAVEVFLVVGRDELAIHQHAGGIDPPLRSDEAPKGFAGQGIDRGEMAAARRDIHFRGAIIHRQHAGGEGAVLRLPPGRGSPDEIARGFLIGVKAVAGGTITAPVRGDAAHDHQIAHNDGRADTAIREAQTPDFLKEAALPGGLAIAVHRDQFTGGRDEVNETGFLINRRSADGITAVGIVAQKVGEAFFPKQFARLFIKAGQPLGLLRAFAFVAEEENTSVGHHGSPAAGDVVGPVRGIAKDVFRIFLGAGPILVRSAPGIPIIRHGSQRGEGQE